MTNAERLAAWRKLRDLSQDAAASKIGVAQGTWAPWEAGKKVPGLKNALAIEKLTRGAVKARDWEEKDRKAADSGTNVTAPEAKSA